MLKPAPCALAEVYAYTGTIMYPLGGRLTLHTTFMWVAVYVTFLKLDSDGRGYTV